LKHFCGGGAEGAVSGDIAGERRRWDVAPEMAAVDELCSEAGASPRARGFAVEQEMDGGNGPNGVRGALAVPHGDGGVHQGIAKDKEHLHVIIDSVGVTT